MSAKEKDAEQARKPVFDTEDLADEKVAREDPGRKSFWSRYALKAILSVDLSEEIVPKPLSEADVDEVCRGALAGGLTPGELDSPFNH